MIGRAAQALHAALPKAQSVTHAGAGWADVHEVASNRRIHGPDGKVRAVRYTATADPALRAEPEGVIDPQVSVIGFWQNEKPLAGLSYYATHPQSYYRTGIANPDFPGIARILRQQQVPVPLHLHFTGAGGNIGAGKYNGHPANRAVLANRPAKGMEQAWLRRCQAGVKIPLSCLSLGPRVRVLHMPGELFVEYQLAAKKMRPDCQVAMAAYGDYGPGYIGTAAAYAEGGYETGPASSFVAPQVEEVLTNAMRRLLVD